MLIAFPSDLFKANKMLDDSDMIHSKTWSEFPQLPGSQSSVSHQFTFSWGGLKSESVLVLAKGKGTVSLAEVVPVCRRSMHIAVAMEPEH